MHIRDLDLNLLRVFDAVHRHRSVSRAAEQLGLSQPAVSHALTRLRLLLKDALFVRSGAGMRPTPRADQLALAVAAALEMLEQALLEAEVFDPRRSSKTFRLHMSDMGEGVFLPGLMHDVRRVAPGVRIDSYQFEIAQIEEALEVGGLDFAIGFLPGVEGTAQHALLEAEVFDPRRSSKTFRLHMSDMGEGVFLPGLMHDVRRVAPGVRIDSYQFEIAQIEEALEVGGLDFAIGFLPGVEGTAQHALLDDRYVLLMRAGHPQAEAAAGAKGLRGLDYILVRQHTQTAHLLQRLGLQDRVRLSIPHFMVLPRLVADTDLAVILPRQTALGFAEGGAFRIVETDFGEAGFTVALHWSRRRGNDPALRWLRELIVERFAKLEATPHATKAAPAR